MANFFQALDESMFRFINGTLSNPLGDVLFPLFNSGYTFIPLFLLGLIWLARKNSKRLWLLMGTVLALVLLNDLILFNPLKAWVNRPRPAVLLQNIHLLASGATGGYSFPSSHTANCFLAATLLSLLLGRHRILFFSIATVVGLARIYVGVHYPLDILGSAFLGSGTGLIWFTLLRQAFPNANDSPSSPPSPESKRSFWSCLDTPWAPLVLFLALQGIRLAWKVQYGSEISPATAFLGTHAPYSLWFKWFGNSALSTSLLPWGLQTAWFFALAGFLLIKKYPPSHLWCLLGLIQILPLFSQLSFTGSPGMAFAEADYPVSDVTLSFCFYTLIGLPLWMAALFFFRSHPMGSFFTIAAWIVGSSKPQIPWLFVAFATSGTLLYLSINLLTHLKKARSFIFPTLIALTAAHCLITTIAVHNPMFLKKLNISILPRNSPLYSSSGWDVWIERIHPQLSQSPLRPIWTDSESSKNQIRFLLGPSTVVESVDPSIPIMPPGGAFYIREVYMAQINPRILFVTRTDWKGLSTHFDSQVLDALDLFMKGQPIRKFQLFYLTPKTSNSQSQSPP